MSRVIDYLLDCLSKETAGRLIIPEIGDDFHHSDATRRDMEKWLAPADSACRIGLNIHF